jgi:hypothetical protein
MPTQDTSKIKERIISILKRRGPSLPVHIAKEINVSILFASAFLSELISEQSIKMSHMRVGSSPIYFIQGQETRLENFYQHLKSREKDAYILLKQKKILKDIEQEPAIRVALRAIKDFSIPFKKDEQIFWRFFTIPESDFKRKEPIKKEITPFPKPKKELNIFDKKEPKPQKKKTKKPPKANEIFFTKVKEFLSQKEVEISGIESFSRNTLLLKIKIQEKEKLLVAYNKKRITETDIIKAHNKALELNLTYIVLSLGEPSKKLNNFINAIKDLADIGKLE